ncbi:MAG TPA: FAD-binding oxidoreductase [Candidatus Limnocylindrales bacterium]|nr:FAD-binding oxidoreductase [Candidatus Limnocylindrales bacterium]
MNDAARELRARTRDEVLQPHDDGYEPARAAYNALATGRPAWILRPADESDIVAAVRWAAEADLPIGVRGGGHSVAGHSSPDGALLVDLSRWRGASVDPVDRTADALAGSRLMDLDAATFAHGLAAPSGTFIDTGIGGLTLTGGISWLLSSEGFACDALIGARLVTSDGDVLEVDDRHEPDLLWGLRGGGGNFGIATHLRYALAAVPAMYGGRLRFAGDGLRDAILCVFELDAGAPDELVLAVVGWRAEDGSPRVSVNVGWRGDADAGAAAIGALIRHRALYESDLKTMSWLQQEALYQPIPFGLRQYWKGHLVGRLDGTIADALIAAASEATSDSFVLVELIHGKAHRIAAESAAFGGRAAVANVTALAIWSDATDDEPEIAWARRFADRVAPRSLRGGGYLNYPELDQTAGRVAAAYPPHSWARLRQLKRRLDPANRFRFNANIPPAE